MFNEAGQYGTNGRQTKTYDIQGKLHPPSDVTGFKAYQNGATVSFIWDGSPDVDIESTYIRREPKGRGGSFEDAITVKDKKGTNTTTKDVPPGDWTFMAKHKDTSRLWSDNAATFDLTVDNTQDVLTDIDYAPDWNGILFGCVRHWSGVLVPSSTSDNATLGWRVFDEVVPDPIDYMAFEPYEEDFDFVDTLRVSVTGSGQVVPLQSGEANPVFYIDHRNEYTLIKEDKFIGAGPLEDHDSDSGGRWTSNNSFFSIDENNELYDESGANRRVYGDEIATSYDQEAFIIGKPSSTINARIGVLVRASYSAGLNSGYQINLRFDGGWHLYRIVDDAFLCHGIGGSGRF